MINELP